jgi:hypothetical protein
MAAERLAPRALTDLLTDPLDLAAALFASRLVDTRGVPRDERPATPLNRLPALETAADLRAREANARDFNPSTTRASQPTRLAQAASRLQPSAIAAAFAQTQVTTPAVRSPQQLPAGTRGESATGASPEHPIKHNRSTVIGSTHGSVEHAPATARPPRPGSPPQKPIDRLTPFAPMASTTDRVRAVAHAAVRRPASEPATAPQPGTSARSGAPADEDVTRWVKGAAGLATWLAPPAAPAAISPAASFDAVSPAAASNPGTALDTVTTASVAGPAAAKFTAQSASADVELLMDELERRLELDYLRHYGTSGR